MANLDSNSPTIGTQRHAHMAGENMKHHAVVLPSITATSAAVDILNLEAGESITVKSIKITELGTSPTTTAVNTLTYLVTDGTNTLVSETFDDVTTFPAHGVSTSLGTLTAANVTIAKGGKLVLTQTIAGTLTTGPIMFEVAYVTADA